MFYFWNNIENLKWLDDNNEKFLISIFWVNYRLLFFFLISFLQLWRGGIEIQIVEVIFKKIIVCFSENKKIDKVVVWMLDFIYLYLIFLK